LHQKYSYPQPTTFHGSVQTSDYHILQPSQYSAATEKSKQLVSYREWINRSDPELTIHGPFDFATPLNNRKTRDRILATDWKILAESQAKYHNHTPQLSPRVMSVDINQPTYEVVGGNDKVSSRCRNVLFNLEFSNQNLQDFGL
jgi:hypothetical protein